MIPLSTIWVVATFIILWYLRNWDSSDEIGREACPVEADRADMRQVCRRLDIPFYDVDFVKEYWNEVFIPFIEAYQSGRETPNPDVFCNRHIKFKYFLDYVRQHFGTDLVATGHYAQLLHPAALEQEPSSGASRVPQLLRAIDPSKDQSYFLCMTPVCVLTHLLCISSYFINPLLINAAITVCLWYVWMRFLLGPKLHEYTLSCGGTDEGACEGNCGGVFCRSVRLE